MNQAFTVGRTAVGTSTVVMPADASLLLDFQATTGVVLSGDPSLTYAHIQAPVANGPLDVIWVASGFYNMTNPLPIIAGKTYYVAFGAAGICMLVLDRLG